MCSTSTISSSAPGSRDFAPRSSSRRTASATSSWSRRPPRSAAPGATTPTRARPATSRASSTRSRSRPTRSGAAPTPPARRSRTTSAASPSGPARSTGSSSTPASTTPRWDDAAGRWTVRVTGPTGSRTLTATTLILGAGGLSEPRLPDIEGIETSRATLFHSARWDHAVDLTGKRVAVIGTGASAIQIVPEMQQVGEPPRRLPAHRAVGDPAQRPDVRRASSAACCGACPRSAGSTGPASTGPTRATCRRSRSSRGSRRRPRRPRTANIAKGIEDPALRAKVTPYFEFGCKRVLRSNTYYPALAADNTELVTDPIAKVTGDAIVTADGVERPGRRARRGDRLLHDRAAGDRADHGHRRPHPGRHLARERDGGLQGHDRARLPQPLHAGRPQHRPGPHQHGLHHRVAGRLRPRRDPHDARARLGVASSRGRRPRAGGTPTSSAG